MIKRDRAARDPLFEAVAGGLVAFALLSFGIANHLHPPIPELPLNTCGIRVNSYILTQTDKPLVVGRWIVEARSFQEALSFIADTDSFPTRSTIDAEGNLRVDDLSSIDASGAIRRWWTAKPHTEWRR